MSVWAPPHLVQQGQFAMEVAVSCLNFFTGYFGVPYELSKIGKQTLGIIPLLRDIHLMSSQRMPSFNQCLHGTNDGQWISS